MTSLDGINGLSIQTLLRGENDSKQSDEFQAKLNTGFTVFSNMPKRTEKRDFSQCKELVSPSKKQLENRATSQDEGEDLPCPSSAEDTVSGIL